ncbi:MAG: LacI family DNA-binding transcriptional regulator, partial [Mesorhizobium sp.]
MTDIARAAGCSQATVSFVLNNTPGIRLSQQTRERVIEAARGLGYAPPAFSALRSPIASFEGLDGVIG